MALPSKASFWGARTLPRLRQRDATDAVKWFKSKADSEMSDVAKPSTVFKGPRKVFGKPLIGDMYIYKYFAKHDKTLATWDAHPLVLPVEYHANGFTGLNMHYLPLPLRFQLMAALMKIATKAKGNKREKLILDYTILKGVASAKLYEPTIHRYLYSQTRSNFLLVDPDEWRIALAVPVQKWRRGSPY
jgi:hypothetical protein